MDYIWAKLPIITTEGDSIAKIVKAENIGEVIKYENTPQLARVMESLVVNKSLRDIYRKNLNRITPRFYWENVTKPLVKYCLKPHFATDKLKTKELVDLQNSKTSKIVSKNFEGFTNVLVITKNRYRDEEIISGGDVGKIFFLEVEDDPKDRSAGKEDVIDEIGLLKSKITQRTKFDGIVVNNVFKNFTPKFFYDLTNVLSDKLRRDGLLFISLPDERGLASKLGEDKNNKADSRIDDFTLEFILQEAGFKIIEKGVWDKFEKLDLENSEGILENIYGKNELFELFEIEFDRENFSEIKLLSRFDMLESETLASDKTVKGKLRKYLYSLTSLYFENMRKNYNESIKAINNNIQVQINKELNEVNRKNRERLLLIYFNIFKSIHREIVSLGYDMNSLKEILLPLKEKSKKLEDTDLDQKLEILMRDFENLDELMGLTVSNKYYLVKKDRF